MSKLKGAAKVIAGVVLGLLLANLGVAAIAGPQYAFPVPIPFRLGGTNAKTAVAAHDNLDQPHGADIAGAQTIDLGAATGADINITGNYWRITSLGGSSVPVGAHRILHFANNGFALVASANIITPDGAPMPIHAGQIVDVLSLGSGVWAVSDVIGFPSRQFYYYDRFTMAPGGVGSQSTLARTNDNGALLNQQRNGLMGAIDFPATSNSENGYIIAQPNAPNISLGGGQFENCSRFSYDTQLPDATNDFSIRVGKFSAQGSNVQGEWVRVLQSQNSKHFTCVASNGTSGATNETNADTGVTPVVARRYRACSRVDATNYQTCSVWDNDTGLLLGSVVNKGRIPITTKLDDGFAKSKTAGTATIHFNLYESTAYYEQDESVIRVMPIGDSNTAGLNSCATQVGGQTTGPGDAWRYEAYLDAAAVGKTLIYVGSQEYGATANAYSTSWDDGGRGEGIAGNTINQAFTANSGIDATLDKYQPHVVVINLGTINASGGTTSVVAGDMATLISHVITRLPNVWIVVMDPIPSQDATTITNLPTVITQINTVVGHVIAGSGTDSGGTAGASVTWTTPFTRILHNTAMNSVTLTMADTFHPDCAGYHTMGDTAWNDNTGGIKLAGPFTQ